MLHISDLLADIVFITYDLDESENFAFPKRYLSNLGVMENLYYIVYRSVLFRLNYQKVGPAQKASPGWRNVNDGGLKQMYTVVSLNKDRC